MRTMIPFLFSVLALFLLTSCLKDDCSHTKAFIQYAPVYLSQQEFEAPAELRTPREMQNTGIIFSYRKFLLVNEFQKGIHVIDNHNPTKPVSIGFIEIPGNTHFTIRNDILYANKLEDLLAIDVSDMDQPIQVNRLKDLFQNDQIRHTDAGILAYYENTYDTITVDCNDYRYASILFRNNDGLFFERGGSQTKTDFQFTYSNAASASAESSKAPATMGVGGSMARFTTIYDRLYILSNHLLETVDISIGIHPKEMGDIPIQFNAETIFPFEGHLYIGTTNGMHIYAVSESGLPEHLSTVAHIQSCDPVISDGEYAYVTLRGGTECGGFTNQLEAYNIQNVLEPKLIQQYPMENPHGLTKVGNYLYICEGQSGWKMIESHLPNSFTTRKVNGNHPAYDVLVTIQETLLFVGDRGIYQYALNGEVPKLLSELEIVNP